MQVKSSSTLHTDYYGYINAITNVLLTLNSAVNFLIYCLVGSKFRRIFVAMICADGGGRCLRRAGGDSGGGCPRPGGLSLGGPAADTVEPDPSPGLGPPPASDVNSVIDVDQTAL